jgi:phosphoribosylformylglycinamidine (FGAM) synthase-like enzyme
MREIVAAGLAESAHDLSDGGLAVALAECCFGPAEIGAQSISIATCGRRCWRSTKGRRAF